MIIIAKSICEDERLVGTLCEEFGLESSRFADPALCRDISYLKEHFSSEEKFLVGHQVVNESFLEAFPNLRLVGKYGVGLDNIDLNVCQSSNVGVRFTPGVNKSFVAEHTLGLILSLVRNINVSISDLKSGKWHRDGGVSLVGKTVGIVGFGHVGSELAKFLAPFGCKVICNDILDVSQLASVLSAKVQALDDLLADSDVVSMHVPLTQSTERMCNKDFFGKMKKGSLFINTSRGKVCCLDALAASLRDQSLSAAACDVFPEEPIYNHPLFSFPQFLATPHIAANCWEAKLAMARSAVKHLL